MCTLDVLAAEAVRSAAVADVSWWQPTPDGARCTGRRTASDAEPGRCGSRVPRSTGRSTCPSRVAPVVGRGADLYPLELGPGSARATRRPAALAAIAVGELAAGRAIAGSRPALPATPGRRRARAAEARADVSLRPMRWWDIAPVVELERRALPGRALEAETFWAELALGADRVYLVAEVDRSPVSEQPRRMTARASLVGYAGLSCPRAGSRRLTPR